MTWQSSTIMRKFHCLLYCNRCRLNDYTPTLTTRTMSGYMALA